MLPAAAVNGDNGGGDGQGGGRIVAHRAGIAASAAIGNGVVLNADDGGSGFAQQQDTLLGTTIGLVAKTTHVEMSMWALTAMCTT